MIYEHEVVISYETSNSTHHSNTVIHVHQCLASRDDDENNAKSDMRYSHNLEF